MGDYSRCGLLEDAQGHGVSKQAANHLFTQTVYLLRNFRERDLPIRRYHARNFETGDGLKADHIIMLQSKTSAMYSVSKACAFLDIIHDTLSTMGITHSCLFVQQSHGLHEQIIDLGSRIECSVADIIRLSREWSRRVWIERRRGLPVFS